MKLGEFHEKVKKITEKVGLTVDGEKGDGISIFDGNQEVIKIDGFLFSISIGNMQYADINIRVYDKYVLMRFLENLAAFDSVDRIWKIVTYAPSEAIKIIEKIVKNYRHIKKVEKKIEDFMQKVSEIAEKKGATTRISNNVVGIFFDNKLKLDVIVYNSRKIEIRAYFKPIGIKAFKKHNFLYITHENSLKNTLKLIEKICELLPFFVFAKEVKCNGS